MALSEIVHLSTASVLFFLTTLLLYALFTCYRNYSKCPQFDGPFLAKISGAWLIIHTSSGKISQQNASLFEKYGSPVRISPDKILTNDPVILRHMSTPRSNFRRGTFYDAFSLDPSVRNVMSQKDDKLHNALRTKLIRGYSGKDLPTLESDIEARIADLTSLLRAEASHNRPVDFAILAQYFTLDVLTHIAFGAPVGYLSQNKDVYEYIRKVSEFLGVLEVGANCSSFQRMLDSSLMAPFRPKPTDSNGMGAMLGMASKAVSSRFEDASSTQKPDMLSSFIKHGLTKQEAESEAMIQILGGSDTTATAIRMIILYIITSPTTYTKCMSELDSASNLFDPETGQISSATSRTRLPYIQACIKEGLRVWPPLQALNSKLSPPGGETVNGVFIPGNIEVCHNAYTTQRRKEIYGPDAEFFRPERWLEAAADSRQANPDMESDDQLRTDLVIGSDVEKAASAQPQPTSRLARMESTLELIFGSGRYGCLGRHIAFIELDKVIPVLLKEFEWSVVDPVRGFESRCYGVFVQKGLWLRVTLRDVTQ